MRYCLILVPPAVFCGHTVRAGGSDSWSLVSATVLLYAGEPYSSCGVDNRFVVL